MMDAQRDSEEWARMGLAILHGRGFEDAVAHGVPDTPANRLAFAQLKVEIDELVRQGIIVEFPFD